MNGRIAEIVRAVEEIDAALGDGAHGAQRRQALARGEWLAAAGIIAGEVAGELAVPLERVRTLLGEMVGLVDHHLGEARGPRPLPWPSVVEIRRRLVDAFLEIGRASRLAGDLSAAVARRDRPGEAGAADPSGDAGRAAGGEGGPQDGVDVDPIVERAVALAQGRLAGDHELFLDLGTPPRARGDEALIARAVLQVLVSATYVSEARAQLVVATTHDAESGQVVIAIEQRPPRLPDGPLPVEAEVPRASPPSDRLPFCELARLVVDGLGGRIVTRPPGEPGGGMRLEIRLPAVTTAVRVA